VLKLALAARHPITITDGEYQSAQSLPLPEAEVPSYYPLVAELIQHAVMTGVSASEFENAISLMRITPDEHARHGTCQRL